MPRWGWLWICFAVAMTLAKAVAFQAGAAKRDLTPSLDKPVFIAGFGNNRPAVGIHDPIWARCLSVSDGKVTVAFVGVDFIGFFYEPDVIAVRDLVRQRVKRPVTVLIAATHNHEGPDTLGIWGPTPLQSGRDERYMAWVREQIADGVVEAVQRLEVATLTFAKDDRKALAELQFDSRIPHVKDHTVYVLHAVSKKTGKTIGTLVNWANHPEVLGGKNQQLSADYCWAFYERLEELLGGVALFWNGAIGGLLSPLGEEVKAVDPVTGQPAPEESFRKAELIGRFVAEVASDAVRRPDAVKLDNGTLTVRLRPIFVPLQNPRFRLGAGAGVINRPLYTQGKVDARTEEREIALDGSKVKARVILGEDIRTEVGIVTITPSKAQTPTALFLLIPGEIYPELVYGNITRYDGADFRDAPMEPVLIEHARKTGAKFIFAVGLANDEIGYIIPQCEWDEQPPWLNNAKDRPYGEVNSVGWKAARRVNEGLVVLLSELIAKGKQ